MRIVPEGLRRTLKTNEQEKRLFFWLFFLNEDDER